MSKLIKNSPTETVGNLLGSRSFYTIPTYQREYVWTEDEASSFLDDFKNNDRFEPQYLGMFITDNNEGYNYVIDGQQRLTTIFLLLLSIRKRIKEIEELVQYANNEKDRLFHKKSEIDQNLFFYKDSEKTRRLKSYKEINDFIDNAFLENYTSNVRIINKIFNVFLEYVESLDFDKLINFYDSLMSSEFVHIEIGDASPFEVFERMNARGVDLSVADLLKNKLFDEAHQKNDLDKMEAMWKDMFDKASNINDKISKLSFGTLIRYFYISRFGYINDKRLYKALIDKYKNYYNSDIYKFIKDFDSSLDLLLTLSKSRDELSQLEIRNLPGKSSERGYLRTILALKEFSVIQPYSLLLALFAKDRDMDIRSWLNKIEIFHFVYSFLGKGAAREFEKKYADLSPKIFNAKDNKVIEKELNDFTKQLESILKESFSFDLFVNNIKSKLIYGKSSNVIRFYYEYLEEEYYGRNLYGNTFINDQEITLDHVLPKNKEEINFIGNLIVLEKDINNEIKDKDFNEKKKLVLEKPSGISVTKELFSKYNEWDNKTIEDWADYSAKLFWDNVVKKFFPKI